MRCGILSLSQHLSGQPVAPQRLGRLLHQQSGSHQIHVSERPRRYAGQIRDVFCAESCGGSRVVTKRACCIPWFGFPLSHYPLREPRHSGGILRGAMQPIGFRGSCLKKGSSLETVARSFCWPQRPPEPHKRQSLRCALPSAFTNLRSSSVLTLSRSSVVRRQMGGPIVKQRSGVACRVRAGRLRSLERLQRTRGSSVRGEMNYSHISTPKSNRVGLTRVGRHGILQPYWESEHDGMPRCNARMALRVKRNWRIVWWCMIPSTSPLQMPSTSRLPLALPPRRCNFLGETRA